MSVLSLATDIRAQLPRQSWSIGRRPATTSITVHWNGPAVDGHPLTGNALLRQLASDADWQMKPGWGGSKDGAPHLMYHLVIDGRGLVYQTADLDEQLWHCAHQDGNTNGLAVHFPVGVGQLVTAAQWAAGLQVIDALQELYNVPRSRVFGHLEWKHATACPGPDLMARLLTWRGNVPLPKPTRLPGLRHFCTTARANVRQGPDTCYPVAGTLSADSPIWVDVVKTDGGAVGGDRRWVHLARVPNEQADLGFVHWSLVKELAR